MLMLYSYIFFVENITVTATHIAVTVKNNRGIKYLLLTILHKLDWKIRYYIFQHMPDGLGLWFWLVLLILFVYLFEFWNIEVFFNLENGFLSSFSAQLFSTDYHELWGALHSILGACEERKHLCHGSSVTFVGIVKEMPLVISNWRNFCILLIYCTLFNTYTGLDHVHVVFWALHEHYCLCHWVSLHFVCVRELGSE